MDANEIATVELTWACQECNHRIGWSYYSLVECGDPICGECESEMELITPVIKFKED